MRYFVRISDLGQKISYLEKKLDIIYEKINTLETAKNNVIWEGEGADSFYSYYNTYIENLKEIEKKTLSFIEFLISYYDKYGNEYASLRSKYRNIIEEVQ